jgi:hypothetical protein
MRIIACNPAQGKAFMGIVFPFEMEYNVARGGREWKGGGHETGLVQSE